MLSEGSELVGESGKTYIAASSLGQANVWAAMEKGTHNIVVLKEPDATDPPPWAKFQHEMVMHEMFKNTPSIRKQVDRVAPVAETGGLPTLVLEMFETTVWQARTKRPFTVAEVKAITKAALVGLRDIHSQGLVYADLKMQNIMLNGFDVHGPGDISKLVVKLGDLGIVMPPAKGQVQPIVYRAPEVHFKGEITSKADIWGWGLIYCHLLEAQSRFSKTGLYDDLDVGSGSMGERMDAVRFAIANDYEVHGDAYYRDVRLPQQDHRGRGNQWEKLRQEGLGQADVDFLRWVMRADPRKRPSAQEILASRWLDVTEADAEKGGFMVPLNSTGHATMEFDPRRPKPGHSKKESKSSRMAEVQTADQDAGGDEGSKPMAGTWRQSLPSFPGMSTFANGFPSAPTSSATGGVSTTAGSDQVLPAEERPSVVRHASALESDNAKRTRVSEESPSYSSPPLAGSPSTQSSGIMQGRWTPTSHLSPTAQPYSPPKNHQSTDFPTPSPGIMSGPWTPSSHQSPNIQPVVPKADHTSEALPTPSPSVDQGDSRRLSSADLVKQLMANNTFHWDPEASQADQSSQGGTQSTRPGLPSRNTGTYLSYRSMGSNH